MLLDRRMGALGTALVVWCFRWRPSGEIMALLDGDIAEITSQG